MFQYLTGVNTIPGRELITSHNLGFMLGPGGGGGPRVCGLYPTWAADNGCFTPPGKPDRWDETRWLRYLERVPRDGCLFAVAPDVPFDWDASWARSEPYIDRIRDMGFRVAVAFQNGAKADAIAWDAIDVAFIGGDTAWKLSTDALYIVRAARDHGLPTHMGRANSLRRFRRAAQMTVDTADGTFLKYGDHQTQANRLRWMLDSMATPDGHQLALA